MEAERIQLVLAFRELDELIEDDPPEKTSDDYKLWSKKDNKAKAIIGL